MHVLMGQVIIKVCSGDEECVQVYHILAMMMWGSP